MSLISLVLARYGPLQEGLEIGGAAIKKCAGVRKNGAKTLNDESETVTVGASLPAMASAGAAKHTAPP
ncbi:hypothetical protein O6471_24295, partial [Salmonella enterica subsp. enterica]